MNEKRETLLAEVKRVEEKVFAIREEMTTSASPKKEELTKAYNAYRREALCLKSQALAVLPIQIEGFLGEDDEEVDHDEHGRVMEIVRWLGCPNLNSKAYYPTVAYEFQNDISEIFKLNAGKYLRITIEAIDVKDRSKCDTCLDKFKCYTTSWKF